ncbi:MAG TPA: Uma2 family endonuclease [Solirubrobacteraceae bacterium]|nr:Uma2 family endonuclease [Solirubrobacteraceae bacterium]
MSTVVHPHVDIDEFEALQENALWTLGMELIDGEAVVMPPIGQEASSAQGELHLALRRWQEDAEVEGVLLQDVFVALPGENRPAPDISWWSAEHLPPPPLRVLDRAKRRIPDLVVEVLSPSTRANGLGAKRELYMRSGVPELWLVDPDARTVTRVRPGADDEVLGDGESLTSELLDGFALEVARIFPF